MTFRAGDVVDHGPSGETWVLACDETDDAKVVAAGWPESVAEASDCTIKKVASDDERISMLQQASSSLSRSYSYRASLARYQLAGW